jgi:hypothetical protein
LFTEYDDRRPFGHEPSTSAWHMRVSVTRVVSARLP